MSSLDLLALLPSWELHLRDERKTPATVRLYSTGVRTFLAWCRRTGRPATLDRATVTAFVADLLDGGAEAATARARHLALRRFAAWLVGSVGGTAMFPRPRSSCSLVIRAAPLLGGTTSVNRLRNRRRSQIRAGRQAGTWRRGFRRRSRLTHTTVGRRPRPPKPPRCPISTRPATRPGTRRRPCRWVP
jgi:hypothetical protein